ncbi:MAG: exodeoxyribonuclease VII large subunit [Candidatus Anammoxibacter sp.]
MDNYFTNSGNSFDGFSNPKENDRGFYSTANDEFPGDGGFEEGKQTKKIFTVTELTKGIKETLEGKFICVWVAGEVSNVRKPSSGHVYLTLKDENAQLQAVIFRSVGNRIKFELKDGVDVLVYGSISVYEPRGQYQIKVETIEPKGIGALQLAFQQLKSKLAREGLFDAEHKKDIPFLPETIAIVTSPTGAAIKDIVNIINRRFPGVQTLLYPVRVQGEGAAEEIAKAICDINCCNDIDVMIVGRGGGSVEDLWAFNEEVVARSIYNSKIPVISAVGHEIDFTIADFVADRRALTPSEAGEMVVPRSDMLLDKLTGVKNQLNRSLQNRVLIAKNRLQMIAKSYVFSKPLNRIYDLQQRLDDIMQKLGMSIKHTLGLAEKRLSHATSKLDSLSPLGILSRGYSITTKVGEVKPLRDIDTLKKGDRIMTKISKGDVISVVEVLS